MTSPDGETPASLRPAIAGGPIVYGVAVQTLSSVWLVRIPPPGPCFQANHEPFCETMQ
jgi:hypothetical protein